MRIAKTRVRVVSDQGPARKQANLPDIITAAKLEYGLFVYFVVIRIPMCYPAILGSSF
jgi:hypothetical protein